MTRSKKITIVGGIILAITITVLTFQFSAPQKGTGEEVRIVVPLGAPKINDAEQAFIHSVNEKGLIRSPFAFSLALWLKGMHLRVEPGGYIVKKGLNAFELADVFKEPDEKWVVIPEGLRKEEIAERLAKTFGWNQEEQDKFLNVYTRMKWELIEGVYFPDTYLMPVDEGGLQIAQRMINRFNEKFVPYSEQFLQENIKWDTALKIASLVQREAAGKEDMPLIAGIIWNRLLSGMKLEIDATVQYAKGKTKNGWWSPIKPEDKQIDSPYNTYLYKGLPPHPIANPGLAAIEAVIYSEETDYLYYLHDEEGKIHPALTYEEHLENIREYLGKSYRDEGLGYEIKYPLTWSIVGERKDFGIELSRIVFQSKDYEEKESEEYKERVEAGEETGLLQPMVMDRGVKFELLITKIPSDFKWQSWAKRATDYPYGKLVNEKFLTLEKKEIYGRQVESEEIASTVISFPDSEETKLFELIFYTLKKDKEKNLETFKQILSTFRFTKDIKQYFQAPEIGLIPPDFFMPSFNEEGKIEFKAEKEQIELLE